MQCGACAASSDMGMSAVARAYPKRFRRVGWKGTRGGLDKEGPQRLLEGGDGTVGIGEGGLEMGEDLGRGSVFRGQLGGRAAPEECGADGALAEVESLPDAQQGPVAEMAVEAANGGEDAAGNGALEEAPESAGGEAEASDFVGGPDAERVPAAGTCIAVATKDPLGTERFLLGVAVVKSVEKAVPNESADNLAVRTRGQLEPFGNRVPFVGVAEKPSLVAHVASSAKS